MNGGGGGREGGGVRKTVLSALSTGRQIREVETRCRPANEQKQTADYFKVMCKYGRLQDGGPAWVIAPTIVIYRCFCVSVPEHGRTRV